MHTILAFVRVLMDTLLADARRSCRPAAGSAPDRGCCRRVMSSHANSDPRAIGVLDGLARGSASWLRPPRLRPAGDSAGPQPAAGACGAPVGQPERVWQAPLPRVCHASRPALRNSTPQRRGAGTWRSWSSRCLAGESGPPRTAPFLGSLPAVGRSGNMSVGRVCCRRSCSRRRSGQRRAGFDAVDNTAR